MWYRLVGSNHGPPDPQSVYIEVVVQNTAEHCTTRLRHHFWNLCGTYEDPQMRLTDISLRSLKPRSEQYAVFDDTMSNFGVRVGTTGKLSFFVMYRTNGRRKRDTLGQFPIV